MAEERFIVEVEKAKDGGEGKPSMGPVYRSIISTDPVPPPIPGLDTCWDIFRSVSLFNMFFSYFDMHTT